MDGPSAADPRLELTSRGAPKYHRLTLPFLPTNASQCHKKGRCSSRGGWESQRRARRETGRRVDWSTPGRCPCFWNESGTNTTTPEQNRCTTATGDELLWQWSRRPRTLRSSTVVTSYIYTSSHKRFHYVCRPDGLSSSQLTPDHALAPDLLKL